MEGQLQLLAARLESVAAPAAARCAAVLSGTELEAGGLSSLPVTVSARRSYVLPLQLPAGVTDSTLHHSNMYTVCWIRYQLT